MSKGMSRGWAGAGSSSGDWEEDAGGQGEDAAEGVPGRCWRREVLLSPGPPHHCRCMHGPLYGMLIQEAEDNRILSQFCRCQAQVLCISSSQGRHGRLVLFISYCSRPVHRINRAGSTSSFRPSNAVIQVWAAGAFQQAVARCLIQ